MRGWAAMIVVITHFLCAFRPSSIFGGPETSGLDALLHYPPFSLLIASHAAVMFFFVLSAFVLSWRFIGEPPRMDRLIGCMVKRPLRLGALVVLTMVVASFLFEADLLFNVTYAERHGLAAHQFFASFWRADLSLPTLFLRDILTPFASGRHYNGPLWTIEYELYGSWLVYGVLFIRTAGWRCLVYAGALVLFRGSLYQGFIFGILLADVTKYFYRHPWSIPSAWRSGGGALLLVLSVVMLSYSQGAATPRAVKAFYAPWPSIPLVGGGYAMLGSVVLLSGLLMSPRFPYWLNDAVSRWLGRVSYSLYAGHWLVMGSLGAGSLLVLERWLPFGAAIILTLGITLGAIVVMAEALTRWVDDPVVALASRIESRVAQAVRRGQHAWWPVTSSSARAGNPESAGQKIV